MITRLSLPAKTWAAQLSEQQLTAVKTISGAHLLLGAAGSGKTTVALQATANACAEFGLDQVWVIAASRGSAAALKAKLIAQNPATTPRVITCSALAYAALRTQAIHDSAGEINLKMLTGPEQESRIRELLANAKVSWPTKWQSALNTKVFASDLRRWIDISLANQNWHPEPALAKPLQDFVKQLLAETNSAAELNYTQAHLAAAELISTDNFIAAKQFAPKAIIVDDLHDFDPSQLKLLLTVINRAEYSFVTSNSDAAALSFRGVGLEITKNFRDAISPKVHVLAEVFRHGENIGKIVKDFLPTLVAPDLSESEVAKLRTPKYSNSNLGVVQFEVSASSAIRDALIVDRIMQARVNQNLDFTDIAIIGRSFSTLANLRRALAEAAIPVEYSPDNVPLARDPAAAQLLHALSLASRFPNHISNEQLIQFATSEIVGMNAAQLRRTAQLLRKSGKFGSTVEVVADAIRDKTVLAGIDFDPALQPVRRAAVILHGIAKQVNKTNSVAEVLWYCWQAKINADLAMQLGYDADEAWVSWPDRLAQQAKSESAAGRAADRDLDAVLALFDAADRTDRSYRGSQSVENFVTELSNQDASSDILISRAITGVAVLTAHRARSREWKLVILVDLQEGVWPAGNVRESIIEPRDAAGQRQRLAEERRLAAAAAATSSEKLVLAVVDSKVDQGSAPSGLLMNFELPERITAAPPSMLTIRGLIAQLRATSIDESASEQLRQAAISRLGYLAKLTDPKVAPAKPENWWFIADVTQSERSLIDPTKQIPISGSMLDSITRCPTQWFFERKVKVQDQPVANTVVGLAIHSVAEKIVNQNLSDLAAIAELEKIWPSSIFDAPWQSQVQLQEAKQMVKAVHNWITNQQAEIAGTELKFTVVHAELDVVLVGHIDLLLKQPTGEFEVVDYKTGAAKPTVAELQEHTQLGIYQLAVSQSSELNPNQAPVSAKLVQIRLRNSKDQVVEQVAPDLTDSTWLESEILAAKTQLLTEDLPARPGGHCRNCKVRNVCPAVPEGDQVTA